MIEESRGYRELEVVIADVVVVNGFTPPVYWLDKFFINFEQARRGESPAAFVMYGFLFLFSNARFDG